MIIAIDGPAGSGKSTQARLLAERLGFSYFNTGAMYRLLTAKAIAQNIDPHDESALLKLIPTLRFTLSKELVIEEDLDIRSQEVDQNVSYVARHPKVRREMVRLQRNLICAKNVVLEGRDAATVIAPGADIKLFLTASDSERIARRKQELIGKKEFRGDEEIARSVQERDRIDSERKVAPLRPAKGAVILDTTGLSIEEAALKVLKECNRKSHRINFLYQFLKIFGLLTVIPLYFRLKARGREWVPKQGGFIVASNHRSHLDPMIVGFSSPRMLSFMARDNLFHIPFFGWFIRSLNANPIKRGHADLAALKSGLQLLFKGHGLMVFPEATRSQNSEMGPGKPGVAMMALRSGVPVIPAWVEGTQKAMPKGSSFIQPAQVTVTFGPPVPLDDLLMQPLSRENYDQALHRIMNAIKALRI